MSRACSDEYASRGDLKSERFANVAVIPALERCESVAIFAGDVRRSSSREETERSSMAEKTEGSGAMTVRRSSNCVNLSVFHLKLDDPTIEVMRVAKSNAFSVIRLRNFSGFSP